MAHELMFDPDDPVLARVREICLGMPGAREKISVGHPNFFTRKVFCWYAMAHKIDGVWIRQPQAISVLLPESDRRALLGHPDAYVPGYIGPSGWVGLVVNESTDWVEVAELIEESFRFTASKRLVDQLDARRPRA